MDVPHRIHIVMGYDGRPTGMAFAEFASPQDALTAMAKHRCVSCQSFALTPARADGHMPVSPVEACCGGQRLTAVHTIAAECVAQHLLGYPSLLVGIQYDIIRQSRSRYIAPKQGAAPLWAQGGVIWLIEVLLRRR